MEKRRVTRPYGKPVHKGCGGSLEVAREDNCTEGFTLKCLRCGKEFPETSFYNYQVQEILNALDRHMLPYELITIEDTKTGTVSACIVFENARWDDSNILVQDDSQVKS